MTATPAPVEAVAGWDGTPLLTVLLTVLGTVVVSWLVALWTRRGEREKAERNALGEHEKWIREKRLDAYVDYMNRLDEVVLYGRFLEREHTKSQPMPDMYELQKYLSTVIFVGPVPVQASATALLNSIPEVGDNRAREERFYQERRADFIKVTHAALGIKD